MDGHGNERRTIRVAEVLVIALGLVLPAALLLQDTSALSGRRYWRKLVGNALGHNRLRHRDSERGFIGGPTISI
jgi:hypothetical protein